MAFDISALTNAVNKYLYSISDVNKLLSEGAGSTSQNSNSDLAGIFDKYLTKAVQDTVTGSDSDMSDEDVAKALTSLKAISTGLDTGTSDLDDSAFSSSLPDLTGLGALSNLNSSTSLLDLLTTLSKLSDPSTQTTGNQTSTANSRSASNTQNSRTDPLAEQIAGNFTSLNLEAEIQGVFSGMDNLPAQIRNKIASRDITGEINKSIENLDIKGDIQRSIASHDRSDEASSYNATRLKNYKKQASGTSVFGDYRL